MPKRATEEFWDVNRPPRTEWLEEQLVQKLARYIAREGSTQYDIARNGFTGVSQMSDEEFYEACRDVGILRRNADGFWIYDRPVSFSS